LGFSIEGILRKDAIYDEEPMDMVIIGMLKEEF
jgi:RimJ/RimL family protein N-acetyltransferase